MKENGEAEEPEEEVEVEAVPVETESYVNLRKKMESKHSQRVENLLPENAKLCREFQRKQVDLLGKKNLPNIICKFGS